MLQENVIFRIHGHYTIVIDTQGNNNYMTFNYINNYYIQEKYQYTRELTLTKPKQEKHNTEE